MKFRHRKTIFLTTLLVLGSFAFSFALVPLYNTFCQALGLSTKVRVALDTVDPNLKTDVSRKVIVQFTTTNNENLPWNFYPQKTSVTIFPGKKIQVFFVAKNNTANTMTVQAIPDITPTAAIKHFHKVECFCFNQQTLASRESKTMPVVFYIDNDLPKTIQTITLAYTLFDVTNKKGLTNATTRS